MFSWSLALILLLGLGSTFALPKGFHDEVYLGDDVLDFGDPMDFEFYTETDGSVKVILVDRLGYIYWIDNPEAASPSKQLILDISSRVCGDGSRGLLSTVLHPNFRNNRWIYIFYTRVTDGDCALNREEGPVNRVARYEVNPFDNTVDESTELVLLESSRTDMKFGKDGYLYISTGDGGHKANSQDTSDLMGSMLRVTEDGSIPPGGNAFTTNVERCNVMGRPPAGKESARCAETWAKGLRNPFRFAMDPDSQKTRFLISDVGGGTWEEIDEGGEDFRGANYGWEVREGPCKKNSDTDCAITPPYTDPIYWYIHDGISGAAGGGSVVGGAFVPNGLWPSEYDGKFIFGDYVYGELYLLTPSESCRNGCGQPAPGFTNTTIHQYPKIIDVQFGPYFDTQALYYLSRDTKVRAIRRMIYTGTEGNRPPVPLLTASTLYAEVGELIEFDASQSFDPDGDRMKFKYQFGKEKSLPWSLSPLNSHQFNEPGTHRVRLRVKDNSGDRDIVRMKVEIGDLPDVEITSPIPGTKYSVGDRLILSAAATESNGSPVPASKMSWEIRKHHNVHYHPFFDGVGNNLVAPDAPEPEDLYASTDSYLEVILRVAGSNGLVREVRENVLPNIVELDFDSSPSGLALSIFDTEVKTPIQVSCWDNQFLEVEAIENANYSFLGWTDSSEKTRVIHVQKTEGNAQDQYTFVASYEKN